MRKILLVFILLAGILAVFSLRDHARVWGADMAIKQDDNQAIKDEGYGNDDEEYNNSERNVINDDGSGIPSENASENSQD